MELLERNTVTSPDTLKKIESCLQMIPMAEIPTSTQHTFDSMLKELKDMVLGDQVSKECTALVKRIVEERQKKRNEWVKFGRNIWGENGMPVEQVESPLETLLGSLSNLKLEVRLSLGGADVQGLVKKVGLKLFVEAVFGVEQAEVAMYSGGHLRELLRSMEDSNMQLNSLTLRIPRRILQQLPEALLTNLSKVTFVKIKLSSLFDYTDFTIVLLELAENQFKKLKGVSLEGGSLSISRDADSAKMVAALASLRSFHLSIFFHGKALQALKGIPGVNVVTDTRPINGYLHWYTVVNKGTIF